MECLLAYASVSVKKGGVRLAKAMRVMAFPAPKLPMNTTNTTMPNYNFELEKYNVGIKRANTQYFEGQDRKFQAQKY